MNYLIHFETRQGGHAWMIRSYFPMKLDRTIFKVWEIPEGIALDNIHMLRALALDSKLLEATHAS